LLPPPPTDPYVSNSLIRFVSNGPDGTINLAGDEPARRHGCCCPSECNSLRSDSCAIPTSSVETGCGLNVPPAFPWCGRHARHCLPAASGAFIVGPLGLGSPRFRAGVAPCPAVLCVATTAFVHPGRSALCSLPVPWFNALLFVSLPACARFGSSVGRVARQTPGCWLRRSPLLRRLLPRRRQALPSSRITLLPTCPALRPRWCPLRLPWRQEDCCLPKHAYGRL